MISFPQRRIELFDRAIEYGMSGLKRPELFVKSLKVETGREFHASAGPFENAHTMRTSENRTSVQDGLAKRLLENAKIEFDLVDLSKGVLTNFAARFHGIRETPTLRVEKGTIRLHRGVKAISKYVDETQPHH